MKKTFERPLPPIVIPGGFAGSSPIALPPVHYLFGINFRLSVTCTGNTQIHTEALARSVTFRFKYGNAPSVSIPGHVLLHRNQFLNAVAEDYVEIPAGAGPNVGTWNGFIPRGAFHRKVPAFTMDDMSLADDPTLEVVFNGIGAISRTGGAAITAITCVASAVMVPRAARSVLDRLRGEALGRILPHVMMNVTQLTDLVASTDDQIRRIRSGLPNSLILLIAENNSPATVDIARSDVLVTRVERHINMSRRGKENWTDLRVRNRFGNHLAPTAGVVGWDFDPDRMLRRVNTLDLQGIETFELAFDTGAAANGIRVWVYQEEIVPPDPEARKKLGLPAWA